MDKRFIRLSFIKTFVNTSKVVMENLDIEEARDVRYWRIAKDLAELYPTLQLMAEELNEDWGFNIRIPQDEGQGYFEKAEDFYGLYSDISEQAERNEYYAQAKVLLNPNGKKFVNKAENLAKWCFEEGDEFDRFWLNKNMVLASAFTKEMNDEVYSNMLNSLLEKRLAEKINVAVMMMGGIFNTEVEDIRNVLGGTAEKLSLMSGFVSEKKVRNELLQRFHEDCNWDSKNNAVVDVVETFVEPFTQIVSENREKFFYYHNNHDAAVQIRDDFYNVMGEDTYLQLQRQKRNKENLSSENSNVAFSNRDNEDCDLEKLEAEVPPFKPGSEDAFWENYEDAENVDGELKTDVERFISQLVRNFDDSLAYAVDNLRYLESVSDEYDEEDEDAQIPNSGGNLSEDNFEVKNDILSVAKNALDLSAVIKNYYNIELNDTPIDRKVVRQFKAEDYWDDFTFNSLNMLFNALDVNLTKNQDKLLLSQEPRIESVDEVLSLPQSLEKRNILKLYHQGLSVMEKAALESKKQEEDFAVDDFTIYHQDEYKTLLDELRWGKEIFSSFTDEKVENWAYDINHGVVLAQVIPLYDDVEEEPDALQAVVSGVENYKSMSKEEQQYIKGLVKRHSDRVVKTHNQILNDGVFDRGLFDDVEVIHMSQQHYEEVKALKDKVILARQDEEPVYKKYRAFRKTHMSRQQLLMQALKQQRFYNK